jgi:hypothetical protein
VHESYWSATNFKPAGKSKNKTLIREKATATTFLPRLRRRVAKTVDRAVVVIDGMTTV